MAALKDHWASKEPGSAAIVTRVEFGLLPRLVEYSLLLAFKAFPLGRARARSLDLQWLLSLAGTRSIERALDFTKPRSKIVVIAATGQIPEGVLSSIGKQVSIGGSDEEGALARLASDYGFTKKALETYSCEELAIERSVLSLFE